MIAADLKIGTLIRHHHTSTVSNFCEHWTYFAGVIQFFAFHDFAEFSSSPGHLEQLLIGPKW
jgi:hypothetical protein